ncbi:hypothetical protein HDU99_006502, partial [Rhizoclosmatium hyalinum]
MPTESEWTTRLELMEKQLEVLSSLYAELDQMKTDLASLKSENQRLTEENQRLREELAARRKPEKAARTVDLQEFPPLSSQKIQPAAESFGAVARRANQRARILTEKQKKAQEVAAAMQKQFEVATTFADKWEAAQYIPVPKEALPPQTMILVKLPAISQAVLKDLTLVDVVRGLLTAATGSAPMFVSLIGTKAAEVMMSQACVEILQKTWKLRVKVDFNPLLQMGLQSNAEAQKAAVTRRACCFAWSRSLETDVAALMNLIPEIQKLVVKEGLCFSGPKDSLSSSVQQAYAPHSGKDRSRLSEHGYGGIKQLNSVTENGSPEEVESMKLFEECMEGGAEDFGDVFGRVPGGDACGVHRLNNVGSSGWAGLQVSRSEYEAAVLDDVRFASGNVQDRAPGCDMPKVGRSGSNCLPAE